MILAARGLGVVGLDGRPLLAGVDVVVEPGTWTAVLGPNGAGKTTLLRALAGTLPPSAGVVTLDDRSLASLERRAIAQVLAVVPQDVPEAPGYSAGEVVAMGRAPHQRAWARPSKEDEAIVDEALARCGLTELARREFASLSGGERRRVLVAQALAQRPKILLLDEPAAFLDLPGAASLFDLLAAEVERGMAIVTVVHDLGLSLQYMSRALLLSAGRVVAAGPTDEVLREPALAAAFGVPVARVEADGVVAFSTSARRSPRP
ncbi:MAG: ABC transporter ATP-binding protein [Myxococcales bacterium]|nr:ABC transporter ATP-binding protein [Myxococcales bacterium]